MSYDIPLFDLNFDEAEEKAVAEAEMKLGNNGAALTLVNDIRARAGNLTPFGAPLTEEELLAERGREMYVENVRRQDLIRFGKFNDAWWEKAASAAKALDVNDYLIKPFNVNSKLKVNLSLVEDV